jgi:hypothetical protein
MKTSSFTSLFATVVLFALLSFSGLHAQTPSAPSSAPVSNSSKEETTAGSGATQESRYLYNMPTAGMLKRGTYAAEGWVFAGGGAMATASVGLGERISFGISYGAGNLIGTGNPNWNPLPAVMLRYRLIDEEITMPAIVLGFESQGRGNYISDAKRYERKSPGFFAVASKNFSLLGFLTLHGGLNYSLENTDDKDLNFFLGAEKTIGKDISVYLQYDAGMNDNSAASLGNGKGFVDAGLRVSLGAGLILEANLINLNNNFKTIPAVSRSFRLEYIAAF